jgi:protein-disulfide isomerase
MKRRKGSQALVAYTIIITVLLVGVFVLNQISDKSNVTMTAVESPDTTSQPLMGNKDARVTIVEFGDYKCPSCKVWGEQILPDLAAEYIDTGHANFSYVNVLLYGDESMLGALSGEAVLKQSPELFWKYHKALLEAQPSTDHNSLWLTYDKVMEVAGAIDGIDLAQLELAITSPDVATLIDRDQEIVNNSNVSQTPTIIINDVVISNPFDYDEISRTIDEMLRE